MLLFRELVSFLLKKKMKNKFTEDKSLIYIGSTNNINRRINQHRYSINNGNKNLT